MQNSAWTESRQKLLSDVPKLKAVRKTKGQYDEQYLRRCHRRLKELDAPLENWHCIEVEDNETDDFVCELCGCNSVRFVHVMIHENYGGVLQIGCICAGYMEGDLIAAQDRDEAAKRKSARKKNYRKKQWQKVSEDKWSLKYKRRSVTIERDSFLGKSLFRIQIDNECYQWWYNRRITTLQDAKAVVFEIIDREEHLSRCNRAVSVFSD